MLEAICNVELLKFTLCVLLTQFGKTFISISRANIEIDLDVELGKSIHIIFTTNTYLNNKQYAKRLNNIEQKFGTGSICILAAKYKGDYKHVKSRDELQGLFLDEQTCPKVILACSNKRRYDDSVEFLKVLDRNSTSIKRAFVHYDELHTYINENLRKQIEEIHNLEIVKGILSITATPDNIFLSSGPWSRINKISLDNFNEADYASYHDMIFNLIDNFFPAKYIRPSPFDFDTLASDTIGFISHVLDKHPDILNKNARVFIPSHVIRDSHECVRDLVFEKNKQCVVVLINGKEKTIQYYSGINIKTIPLLSDDEEVCETISRLVIKHGLENRPIVVTGFLCVSMGQTLTHKSLGSFTSAIFGQMDATNDDIYQLFGRITGRMKNWGDKYVQTQVYCPTLIMQRIHVMEECARNMARDTSETTTKNDYRKPMYEMGEEGNSAISNLRKKKVKTNKVKKEKLIGENVIPFENFETAKSFLADIFGRNVKIKPFHKVDGYELSTRLCGKSGYYKKLKRDLLASDRLTIEKYKLIPPGVSISDNDKKGQLYIVFPVFENNDSRPDEVRYFIRFLEKNKDSRKFEVDNFIIRYI
jgi:hypothetical protein